MRQLSSGRTAIVLVLIFSCVTLRSGPAAAQVDPLAGAALGVGLNALGAKINEAIERAIGGGLLLEIQAGGQVAVLIQQAQAAYQSDLDLTYSRLSAAEQMTVNNIYSVADQFLTNAATQAKTIEARAQQISNSLPFSKTFPQLTQFGPSFVKQDQRAPIRLSLVGNFVDVARGDNNAFAIVSGGKLPNSTKTTQELTFEIPIAAIKTASTQITYNPIGIQIPYDKNTFLWFSHGEVANFSIPLAVLPTTFGTVKIDVTTTAPGTEQQTFTTGEMAQESGDDDIKCGGEHADLAVHSVPADPGWTIIPSTAHWIVTWSQGKQGVDEDWWLSSNCSTSTTACMCVSTEHHGRGTSGKVHFRIQYAAQRPVNRSTVASSSDLISWGTQKVYTIPTGGTWKGAFDRFDGKHIEFAGPYSDQLVHITTVGNNVVVATAPFE
jgi:hypothetical protein